MIGSSYDSWVGDISLPFAQMEAQKVREAVLGGGRQSWGGEEKKFSRGGLKLPAPYGKLAIDFLVVLGCGEVMPTPPSPPRPTGISTSAPEALVHCWPGGEFRSDPQASPSMLGDLKGCRNCGP